MYEKDCVEYDMHDISNEDLVIRCETQEYITELKEQVPLMFLFIGILTQTGLRMIVNICDWVTEER